METELLGFVERGTFRRLLGDLSISSRLTTIQPQESTAPESGELRLEQYEGRVIVVRGIDQGGWIYTAEVVDAGGRRLADAVSKLLSPTAQLVYLNRHFAHYEGLGLEGRAFFESVLDDKFLFRRGDGSTINKAEFLEGLADPGNSSEILEADVAQVQVFDAQADMVVMVRFRGTRSGKLVDGVFRNLRLFELQDGDWRCVMWFNKRVAEPREQPDPQSV